MFLAENFGRHIIETTENSIEITMVFNAYLKGYLGYGQVAFNQEVLCLVDASPQDVIGCCSAGNFFEKSAQRIWAHTGNFRQL